MREIKFRAWDRANKCWTTNIIGNADYDAKTLTITQRDEKLLIDYAVMQFTGLLDKNDKEIYEGDICRWPSGIDRKIIWDNVNACFSTPLNTLQVERGQSTVIGHHLEVIGNIYENPALLKGC